MKNTQRVPSYSRRGFLSGAAALAAGAGVFSILKPRTVFGSEANSKIKLGVVGQGGRGRWIAGLFQAHGGYEISALADYFPQVVQETGEQFKVAPDHRFSGLSGYRKLLESQVDAVALETPPWFFPGHAQASVEAGCHVYMAKPVACDVPGCLQIAELGKTATARKQAFLIDFQTRTNPFYQEAIRMVHEGAIDRITMMSTLCADEGAADPPLAPTVESRLRDLIWCNDHVLGGAYIVNCDIHPLDVALWIARTHPVRALGCARRSRKNPAGESDDVYSITYEFPDGLILNHRGEHLMNSLVVGEECFAYGQSGYLETHYGGRVLVRGGKNPYKGGETSTLYEDGARRNIATFHEAITKGQFDNPTVQSSVESTLACILGREAARENKPLTWDELLRENKRLELDLTGLKE
jgi:predicted dehydrogenase